MKQKRKTRARYTLLAAVSLDGRITRGREEGSHWTSAEDHYWFQRKLNNFDVLIMGRKTFAAIKRPLAARNRIVFSSSPPRLRRGAESSRRGGGILVYLNHPAIQQLNNLLKQQHWTRVAVLGGTSVYDWFLRQGLADELYLTLEPVIFGSGKPLSKRLRAPLSRFSLVSSKKLNKHGTLLLHYKIAT